MRILKLLAAVLVVAVVGLGGFLAKTVKRPNWKPLVKSGVSEALVIDNVRVFTATDAGVLEAQQVRIEDGKIVSVIPTGTPVTGARVIDGAGKTLLPGLIDAHVHVFNTAAPTWYLALPDGKHNLEAYLWSGVTSVVSMGDDLKEISRITGQQQRGEVPGPRVVYAGSPITRTGGHPAASKTALVPTVLQPIVPEFAVEIETPADADAAVARMINGGASFIKMVVDDLPGDMPRLEPAHLEAIVAAAKKRNVKTVAHVGTAEDAVMAVKAGVDGLNHMPNIGGMTPEQVAVIANARIPVVPTMIIFERGAQMTERHYTLGELDRAVEAPDVLEQLSDAACVKNGPSPFLSKWLDRMKESRAARNASVASMVAAGVPLFVGTDSSIIGNIAGASMHHELQMLVAAGVSPNSALLGATVMPAQFFFPKEHLGVIEPGAIADLLLVDGNPLENISATEKIVTVIQGGKAVVRQ